MNEFAVEQKFADVGMICFQETIEQQVYQLSGVVYCGGKQEFKI